MPIVPAGSRLPGTISPPEQAASKPPSRARGSPSRPRTFIQVLSEGRRDNPPSLMTTSGANGVKTLSGQARPSDPRRPDLRSMVERTMQAETRVDALIAAAATGRTFSAGELIALQATVFRYSQTVEVISRAADRLLGSIKQTLGTQV